MHGALRARGAKRRRGAHRLLEADLLRGDAERLDLLLLQLNLLALPELEQARQHLRAPPTHSAGDVGGARAWISQAGGRGKHNGPVKRSNGKEQNGHARNECARNSAGASDRRTSSMSKPRSAAAIAAPRGGCARRPDRRRPAGCPPHCAGAGAGAGQQCPLNNDGGDRYLSGERHRIYVYSGSSC